jgi:hypothetical protein
VQCNLTKRSHAFLRILIRQINGEYFTKFLWHSFKSNEPMGTPSALSETFSALYKRPLSANCLCFSFFLFNGEVVKRRCPCFAVSHNPVCSVPVLTKLRLLAYASFIDHFGLDRFWKGKSFTLILYLFMSGELLRACVFCPQRYINTERENRRWRIRTYV